MPASFLHKDLESDLEQNNEEEVDFASSLLYEINYLDILPRNIC